MIQSLSYMIVKWWIDTEMDKNEVSYLTYMY